MEKLDPMHQHTGRYPAQEEVRMNRPTKFVIIGVFVFMVGFGVITGYFISGGKKSTSGTSVATVPTVSGKNVYGSSDTKTFKDTATGTVEKGGINGEGTHKLLREGGASQTACLVSSVLDLDQFVGKKISINGTTMDAKQCPWLMDVGRVEVLQ